MTDITTLALPKVVNEAMAGVGDPNVPFESRVAYYALLYEFARRINKALGTYVRKGPSAKSEITEHLVRNGGEMGPLYISWDSFEVEWPVNDEGNWSDSGVQEELSVYSLVAPEYVRHVPDHFEINTAALGEAVHMGDPVARQLHTEAKARGWRTEGGRRAALKVREVKAPRKAA
jgi:hypothetical protein